MIWREGVLPENAPVFDSLLSYDLLSYGYSLLGNALRLTESNGTSELSRRAFENSAVAIEAVIARGPETEDRGFHRVVAAAAYHLGSYSARAYSLLQSAHDSSRITVCEQCLVLLMRRDLNELSQLISNKRDDNSSSDEQLVASLQNLLEPSEAIDSSNEEETEDVIGLVEAVLTDAFIGSLSIAMLAFERGEVELLDDAISRLRVGLDAAGELNMVPQWWCHRLAIHLLEGLWGNSFHSVLPIGSNGDWTRLRETFIASLFRRDRAEIDLWPSQVEAASRVLDTQDNLVLALPTSAGKTRIAELCILATLAKGKRTVYVTPLRALSAQTEASLGRTFVPLGKTISSLYGAAGVSGVDQDILSESDIVVATPEKLDFALRNNPNLLDDVGLIVLDEGHMIGANEREIRYEVQVQQLLRRSDAANRRIICLSAILPVGERVEDFVNWLTDDKPDGLIASSWRPTKLRFGEVIWQGDRARLSVTVGDEEPFVPRFLTQFIPPNGQRRTPFPRDQQELCLGAAWRLVDDGQTVLIFCPMKSSVNAYAKVIVDLHNRGALPNVFEGDAIQLKTALTIGEEWFGSNHPILACLRIGVAIHHGSLPTPYRKEIEKLLQLGVLKITISSPTLAQGLNLSASSLIFHSIWRSGKIIDTSEFRNIVGRAGRAYVDTAGLVILPIYGDPRQPRRNWKKLVDDNALRDMASGLMKLVQGLLIRMARKIGSGDFNSLIEYVAGNAAWDFPEIAEEEEEDSAKARRDWITQVASLDCALLSLLNDAAVAENGIEIALEIALESSLWARSLERREAEVQTALRAGLAGRANVLWNQSTLAQRRGYFLAGVGLETGHRLDEEAKTLIQNLLSAEQCVLSNDDQGAIEAIVGFATIVLSIYPFAPRALPANWKEITAQWLQGKPVVEIATDADVETLEFIEDTLGYRLSWALEAVRVRFTPEEVADSAFSVAVQSVQGLAMAAVETGTLNGSASLLMRAGFSSRSGAIAAVLNGNGQFNTLSQLHRWLNSEDIVQRSSEIIWPTESSHDLWTEFISRNVTSTLRTWTHTVELATVSWLDRHNSSNGDQYRATSLTNGETVLETPDARRIGSLEQPINLQRNGLLRVTGTSEQNIVELSYRGPSDLHT